MQTDLTEAEWDAVPPAVRDKLKARMEDEIRRRVEEEIAKRDSEPLNSGLAETPPNLHPQPALQQHVLCEEHQEDIFSKVAIDSTLSDLHSEDEVAVVRFIYLKLAYGPKLPYFDGSPKFALRGLNFLEPNVENIIVGECQSGKSAEAVWTAWCTFFILGCLPVIFVRNNGGKVQGCEDMKHAVEALNSRIQSVLQTAHAQNNLQQHVASDRLQRWISSRRFCLNFETDETKIKDHFKGAGKVLIVLQNPTHLRKMMESFFRGQAKWYAATLNQKQGDKWDVTFSERAQKAELSMCDLRTPDNKSLQPDACAPGTKVRARMPESLRRQEGLMATVQSLYGSKGKGITARVRMVFIMDEADLSVGNPKRSGNKTADILFHQKMRGDTSSSRGAREYVFGSVYITATPQALFICDWKATQKLPDDLSTEDDSDVEEVAADLAPAAIGNGMEMEPAGTGASSASVDAESDGVDQVEGGSSLPREGDARFLKPHVMFADRPDNYIAYDADGWPQNGGRIERMSLDERYLKVQNKFQIYKMVWLQQNGSQDDWRRMEDQVGRTGQALEVDFWPGFTLVKNGVSGTLSVKAPSPKLRASNIECQQTFEMVDSIYRSARQAQAGQSIWQQDGVAIETMIYDMILDQASEYRHGLIISVNTKVIHKQSLLQSDILHHFRNADDLAVVTYNSVDGIVIMFTEGTHAKRTTLFHDTWSALRQVIEDQCSLKGERVPDAISGASEENKLLLKCQPVEVMYEALKGLVSRVVVIAGEIGGRGVAYHDMRHERILTDMYTAQEVYHDRIITQHGELLVQCLGRLNTIETFTQRGLRCPTVRLWAAESVHALHRHYMAEIRALCDAVKTLGDYQAAFSSRPQWITGRKPSGIKLSARMSRPSLSKVEPKMRGGAELPVQLPEKRDRGPAPQREQRPLFPVTSGCRCEARMPLCVGGQDSEGADVSVFEDFQWVPGGGEDWTGEQHISYEVRVPCKLLHEGKAAEYVSMAVAGLGGGGGGGGGGDGESLFIDTGTTHTHSDFRLFRFKTLLAARGLILAGAAGPKEAHRFAVAYGADGGADSGAAAADEDDGGAGRAVRRRLDPGGASGGAAGGGAAGPPPPDVIVIGVSACPAG